MKWKKLFYQTSWLQSLIGNNHIFASELKKCGFLLAAPLGLFSCSSPLSTPSPLKPEHNEAFCNGSITLYFPLNISNYSLMSFTNVAMFVSSKLQTRARPMWDLRGNADTNIEEQEYSLNVATVWETCDKDLFWRQDILHHNKPFSKNQCADQ